MNKALNTIGYVLGLVAAVVLVVIFIGWILALLAVVLTLGALAHLCGLPLTITKTIGNEKFEIGRVYRFKYRPHAVPRRVV